MPSSHTSPATAKAAAATAGNGPLKRWVLPIKPPPPLNQALLKQANERAQLAQSRIADAITGFAGSMAFVYIHIIWFSVWIAAGVEKYPFGLLTMIVSLEAIFLSTFVMISQNRADAKRQVIADAQWTTVQEEDRQNKQLIELSQQILDLTREIRSHADTVEVERSQNEELLKVTKEMLKEAKGRAGGQEGD